MKKTLRQLLPFFALFILPALNASRPNVLVILVDDLGYGDLSSYGAKDLQSPAIDALVGAGMRFDRFYANCPVCSPTRASLLTGCYPELVGVPGVVRTYPKDNWGYFSPTAKTLADTLNGAGYHTAIIGKWHLGLESPNFPNERGFAFFHGFLGDMMDDYYNHRRHGNHYMRRNREPVDPKGHATDIFTDWACDYLKSRKDEAAPFFLYLAYNAPHTPIQPPAEWVAKVKARESGITDRRAKLVALIEHLDAGIGKVMATLEETGLAKNTLVIFTSDNGGQVNVGAENGPLRGGKQDMYEGGIRVPFCAVWPGQIKPATRSDVEALTMDLFPTVCEAVGTPLLEPVDGVSILGVLRGKTDHLAERDLFWHRREGNNRYMGLTAEAMRRGDWKLLKTSPFQPFELYNVKDDPLEENNLAEKNRKQFNIMAEGMRRHIQRRGNVPWQKPD